MTRGVLLVGCPEAFRLLLPSDAQVIEQAVDEVERGGADPAVVVVGSQVANPIFEAQRLARRHRGSAFIVTAGHERLPAVKLQLQITPFVPLSTRVVLDEVESVREAVKLAFSRAQRLQVQRRIARRASQTTARPPTPTPTPKPTATRLIRVLDEHRDAATRDATEALPDLAAAITSELFSDDERELERAAIQGHWSDYTERLVRRGRISFDLGVNALDWTRYYARLRRALIDALIERGLESVSLVERMLSRAQLILIESLARVRDDFERERRHTETVLYAFVETSSDAVITMTLDGTITTWNQGAEARFGYRAAAIVGRHVSTLVPLALREELDQHLDAVRRGVVVEEHHTRRVHETGSLVDVALTMSPIRAEDSIVGVLSVSRDITAQLETKAKLAETSTALRRAERSYQDLYDHSPDMYVSIDTASRTTVRCNETLRRTLGVRSDALVGKGMHAICAPESHDAFTCAIDSVVELGRVENVRLDLLDRDGRTIPVLLTASAAHGLDGEVAYARCAFRDVSEVVALEARKAAMLDAALDAIVTIDHAGTVLEFNPAAEEMFGHPSERVVGQSLADVIIPERLREAHQVGLQRRVEARGMLSRRVELPALHADGREFPVEVSIVRLEGIEPPTFTGFIRDLTDLKAARAQLETTIRTLERSNADLERFAYIASHDLQEPLRMVMSFMELLREAYGGQLDARADKFIGHAVDGAQRMKRLIDDLLEYSRIDTRAKPSTPCDLDAVLARVRGDLAIGLNDANGTLTWSDLPTIWADEGQMEQLLRNLVGNAIKFRHPDRDPAVSVRAEPQDGMWRIAVQDNGIGFDTDRSPRIFEMFQRLHSRDAYPGSGIGLAVAKRIAERHGGRLWAESTPGSGSCFYFEIPRDRKLG